MPLAVSGQTVDYREKALGRQNACDRGGLGWIGKIYNANAAAGICTEVAYSIQHLDGLHVGGCGRRVVGQKFGGIWVRNIENPNTGGVVPRGDIGKIAVANHIGIHPLPGTGI